MSTNRELLELAAKAAGVEGEYESWTGQGFNEGIRQVINGSKCLRPWNPLKDDGDALRLAARLKLNIMQGEFSVGVGDEGEIDEASFVPDESQRLFAIRESIVRAAAQIGRTMP